MNTVKEVIKAAKQLGLHVTENSNAAYAAKNLREANTRILELEAIAIMTNANVRKVKLKEYMEKYHGTR